MAARDFNQAERPAKLNVPSIGQDVLALVSLDGREAVNECFEFRIDALSNQDNINFDQALGENCHVAMTLGDDDRYFDGILTEAQWLGAADDEDDEYGYRLVLRPWFWALTKRRTSKIFRDMPVKDIISDVLNGFGGDFQFLGGVKNPVLEYVVQYQETDYNFVCRMMEEYGYSYTFKHERGKHTMQIADNIADFGESVVEKRPLITATGRSETRGEFFDSWVSERRFTTGKVEFAGYNFKDPSSNMKAEVGDPAAHKNADMVSYEYSGRYVDGSGGKTNLAQPRLDAFRAIDNHATATGDCPSLQAGQRFTLDNHPVSASNTEYMSIACIHSYSAATFSSGGSGFGDGDPYQGSYEMVRTDKPFAPARITPRPFIRGPQTAVVVSDATGGSGENDGDINTDEFGRINVSFHWNSGGNNSMRCRVGQSWAASSWGSVFIPRVGMEVIINFLDGDPDQPIVVGAVYNDDNKHPYTQPDEKNISGFKSDTIGGDGYNEFIFDDTAGAELIRMHAQFDQETVIENNGKTTIKKEQEYNVDVKRTTKIGEVDNLTVGKELKVKSNGTIDMEAADKLTLKVGSSKIEMTPQDITISALKIEIKATGDLKASGMGVTVQGSATTVIKGGVVNIN